MCHLSEEVREKAIEIANELIKKEEIREQLEKLQLQEDFIVETAIAKAEEWAKNNKLPTESSEPKADVSIIASQVQMGDSLTNVVWE